MNEANKLFDIRPANASDSKELAELATQLGYPCSDAVVFERLRAFPGNKEQALLVAAVNQKAVAWIYLEVIDRFYIDQYVEITGFVVHEKYRNMGCGKLLISYAEKWAIEKGIKTIRLKSNVIRKEAHDFYIRNGYIKNKDQYAFMKQI